MAFPTGPTTTVNAIPAYLYTEYNDDQYVQAIFDSYNAYGQGYLDYLNNLNLPIYTNGIIAGSLLDWVGQGIYGLIRPGTLPQTGTPAVGPLNTFSINGLVINGFIPAMGGGFFSTTDDIYKRVLTWHFYKGDGRQMSIPWMKRRIFRFLYGQNGAAPSAYPPTRITGITQANPGVVTTAIPHGLHSGETGIFLSGILGMTAANGGPRTATVISPTTFSFGVNTTGFGTWTSGGVVTPGADARLQQISLAFTGPTSATITLNETVMLALAPGLSPPNICEIFQSAVRAGTLETPFQISWTTVII